MGKKKALLIAGAVLLAVFVLYGIQQPVLFRFGKLPGVKAGEIVLLNPLRSKNLEIQINRILKKHLNAKTQNAMNAFYGEFFDETRVADLKRDDFQKYILEMIEKNERYNDIRCETLDIHDEGSTIYYAINVFRQRKPSHRWDDGQYGLIIFRKNDHKVTEFLIPY